MINLPSRAKARILLCLLPGLVIVKSFSQDQFRLSDYKNPDYRWKQLELGVALAGNNAYMYQKLEKSDVEDRFNSMNFSSDAGIRYYATKNSLHYQGFQDFIPSRVPAVGQAVPHLGEGPCDLDPLCRRKHRPGDRQY